MIVDYILNYYIICAILLKVATKGKEKGNYKYLKKKMIIKLINK